MGKKLAEHNHRDREEKKRKEQNQYVIEVVLAVGVIGGLGYYLYQAKKGEVNVEPPQQTQPPQRPRLKFKMD